MKHEWISSNSSDLAFVERRICRYLGESFFKSRGSYFIILLNFIYDKYYLNQLDQKPVPLANLKLLENALDIYRKQRGFYVKRRID